MQKWPLFRFSRLMDHTSWKQRNVNYPRTVWEIDLCLLRILRLIGCQKVAGHFMLQQYVDFTSLESYHGDNHFILGLTLQSNLTGMCSRVYNRGPKFKHTYRERYCYLVFMIICAAISCRFDGFKLYLVNRHTFRRARFGCVSLYPLLLVQPSILAETMESNQTCWLLASAHRLYISKGVSKAFPKADNTLRNNCTTAATYGIAETILSSPISNMAR